MQSDITLPLFYSDLMDFYSQQPKFGLKAKWDCRISALTAATILRVNQDAPTDVKIALYLILGEVIRMEIKALIFLNHNPEPLVIALDEFRRHLINCDKSDRAI